MVISYICGGLGNQMFQYAMGRRLALHRNVELKLDLSEYRGGTDQRPEGLGEFRRKVRLFDLSVTAPEASDEEIGRLRDPYAKRTTVARIVRRVRKIKPGFLFPATHFREKRYTFDPAVLELPGEVYVEGFWQSEKYFADAAEVIRRELVAKDPAIVACARGYVGRLRGQGKVVVSLHIRRGDLAVAHEQLGDGNKKVHGKPVSMDYVKGAIGRFGAECRFLVFSDSAKDIEWCRQNIRVDGLAAERLSFSDGHSDIQDMALMSACDHHIIANSTFSWWGAWLNPSAGKRVIAPGVWSPPGAKVQMVVQDLIPKGWEII